VTTCSCRPGNLLRRRWWLRLGRGLELTGPNGLLKLFTKNLLEMALNGEMTEHLGHEKNQADPGREATNVRNGSRGKTVVSDAAGEVRIDVPRDREGTFEPQIVKKRQQDRVDDQGAGGPVEDGGYAEAVATCWSPWPIGAAEDRDAQLGQPPGWCWRPGEVVMCRAELVELTVADVGDAGHFRPEDRPGDLAVARSAWLPVSG